MKRDMHMAGHEYTPKERAIWALERKPPLPGLVPTFELEFQLGEELLGKYRKKNRGMALHNWLRRDERTEKGICTRFVPTSGCNPFANASDFIIYIQDPVGIFGEK